MIRAAVLDAGIDLRGLLALIAQHGIASRVTEESGTQVIWVASEAEAALVVQALQRWQELREQGLLTEPAVVSAGALRAYFPVVKLLKDFANAFLLAPVTILLILAAAVVALISDLGAEVQAVSALFYPAFTIVEGASPLAQILSQLSSAGLVLRTLTPILLHFGAIHLVFNALWLWHFGRMIERAQPSSLYLLVVLWIAFVSNATQFLWTLTPNFGGLSGVVYGLLGYIWMSQWLLPSGRLRLPPAMIGFLLLALVLMAVLASSWIANAAHIGGLFAGMVAGIVTAGLQRLRR